MSTAPTHPVGPAGRPLRVLQLVAVVDPDFSYGGPVTVAVEHTRALVDAGHDAVLAAGWTGPDPVPETVDGVPARLFRALTVVPGFRFSGLLAPGLLWWLVRHLRRVDVVHVHYARDLVPLTAVLLARLFGVPYVLMCHGMVIPDERRAIAVIDAVGRVRGALRGAATRLVLMPAEDRWVGELAGDGRPNVTIAQTMALPDLGDDPSRGRDDPPLVVFLARLHPRKQPRNFVAMAVRLLDAGCRARFVVAGPDDGELAAVRELIGTRPESELAYLGPVAHDEVGALLRRATVFVLPSSNEVVPMTVLEAAAVRTPTVCCESCGLAGPLVEAGAGVTVAEDDVDALVEAVGSLLGDPGRTSAMGANARAFVERRYGPEGTLSTLLPVYRDAVAGRRRRLPALGKPHPRLSRHD